MADTLSLERRRAARVAIVIPVELANEHGFTLHSTSDLSVGGAFFGLAIPHPVGSKVKVTLRIPGDEPILCDGVVANVPDSHQFGMGVRFVGLAEADRRKLESFIQSEEAAS